MGLAHDAIYPVSDRDLSVPLPKFRDAPNFSWQSEAYRAFLDSPYPGQIREYIKRQAERRERHDQQVARVWFGIHL